MHQDLIPISGSDDPDNSGHLGQLFAGSSRSHPQKKLSGCDPDRSRELNSIDLREQVAWLNLVSELPSICIYLF